MILPLLLNVFSWGKRVKNTPYQGLSELSIFKLSCWGQCKRALRANDTIKDRSYLWSCDRPACCLSLGFVHLLLPVAKEVITITDKSTIRDLLWETYPKVVLEKAPGRLSVAAARRRPRIGVSATKHKHLADKSFTLFLWRERCQAKLRDIHPQMILPSETLKALQKHLHGHWMQQQIKCKWPLKKNT